MSSTPRQGHAPIAMRRVEREDQHHPFVVEGHGWRIVRPMLGMRQREKQGYRLNAGKEGSS